MKGLLLKEPLKLEITKSDMVKPGPGEVLIEVDNVGLCGSDLHLYKGTYNGPHKYPMYFGHEWAGRVVEDGDGKGGQFTAGDPVTGDCSRFCSECKLCAVDKNLCAHIEKYGITMDGASRQFITLDKKYVYKAPAHVRMDLLSLAEPLAVAARAAKRAAATIGLDNMSRAKALVLGAGPIGLGVMLALRNLYGAAGVYGDDLIETRRAAMIKVGATPVGKIERIGGEDYASLYSDALWDIVVETTGAPGAVERALAEVKPMGVVVLLGFLPKTEYELKLITVKALTVLGSIGGTGNFEDAIGLISSNPEEVNTLVGGKVGYKEAVKAFELGLGRSVAGKVQISFKE